MQRFVNILCAIAPGSDSSIALAHAVDFAVKNQAKLTVLKIINNGASGTPFIDDLLPRNEVLEKIRLQNIRDFEAQIAPLQSVIDIDVRVAWGRAFLEITRQVLRGRHDLVIKTSGREGALDRIFGSDDIHLLRECPCPVWFVKSKSTKTDRRILAAVDVEHFYLPDDFETRNALNCQILEMAVSLALSESAELHIVYVWDAVIDNVLQGSVRLPKKKINAFVKKVRAQCEQDLSDLQNNAFLQSGQDAWEYLNPQTHLLQGSPRPEIVAFSEKIDADLVILGTVSRTGVSGLIVGNTAEIILNRLKCQLLVIKPANFETLITVHS